MGKSKVKRATARRNLMKKALITGITGQDGSYLARALASIAFMLIGFFALSTAITLYAISRLVRKQNTE